MGRGQEGEFQKQSERPVRSVGGVGRKFIAMLVGLAALFVAAFFNYEGIYIYIVSMVTAFICGNVAQTFGFKK